MKSIKIILSESLQLSLMVGLPVAGWQTAVATSTMDHQLATLGTWVHFVLYTLGGFVLLNLAVMIPVAIVVWILVSSSKGNNAENTKRALLIGLIGTLAVILIGTLELFGSRSLIGPVDKSLQGLAYVILLVIFAYISAYIIASGVLFILNSKSLKWKWGVLWGWWFTASFIPAIGLSIKRIFQGNLSVIGLLISGIIVIVLIFAIVKNSHKWTSWILDSPKRLWITFAIGVTLFIITWPIPAKIRHGQPVSDKHPPVILITIDTLRADALTSYPEEEIWRLGTPNIDRLASNGVLFEKAFSAAPWTRPSVPSFLSGLPPSAHGAFADESAKMADGATTLAEILRDSGYATGGFAVNSILRKGSGNEQGFDIYLEEMTYQEVSRKLLFQRLIDRFRLPWPEIAVPNNNPYMERDAVQRATSFIRNHSDERFFLWLHLLAPHTVFYPPNQYRELAARQWDIQTSSIDVLRQEMMKNGWPTATRSRLDSLLALYAGEVRFSDDNVGIVLDTLEEVGLIDSSIVIISSDHGEEFYEHDKFTHGRSLYPEVVHVPFIIHCPDKLESGIRIGEPVSIVDIPPTVLDLAAIDASLNGRPAEFTGMSLMPMISGEEYIPRPVFFERPLHFDQELKGVLYNGFYYIGGSNAVLRPRLYNYSNDPNTYFDVILDYPDEAEFMASLLNEYDAICAEIAGRIGAGRSQADTEQLRALGYIN